MFRFHIVHETVGEASDKAWNTGRSWLYRNGNYALSVLEICDPSEIVLDEKSERGGGGGGEGGHARVDEDIAILRWCYHQV